MIKSCLIRGITYKIKVVDLIDKGFTLGDFDEIKKIIRVARYRIYDDKKIKVNIWDTFYHEWFHAMLYEYNFIAMFTEDSAEEIFCDNAGKEIRELFKLLRKKKINSYE